jgi:hypothetical protein
MYWSHAGSSFELSCLGQWWATLPRDQWPDDVDDYVLADFDYPDHDDIANPIGVGDRRQEVVFIGTKYASHANQELIIASLNQCLLSDDEYKEYQAVVENKQDSAEATLSTRFARVLESKYVAF